MDTFFFSRIEGMRPGTVKLGLQVQYTTGGESMKNAAGGRSHQHTGAGTRRTGGGGGGGKEENADGLKRGIRS